jgi:hypothetical protein
MSLAIIMISLYYLSLTSNQNVYAILDNSHRTILSANNFTFTKQGSFIDSHGMLNIVGVVDNVGTTPAQLLF